MFRVFLKKDQSKKAYPLDECLTIFHTTAVLVLYVLFFSLVSGKLMVSPAFSRPN